MTDQPWLKGMLEMFSLRESIGSVSLSHPESCDCDVCKAALGDEDAFARVVASVQSREDS